MLRRTYESAACVVGIAPYVGELLSGLSLQRLEIMSETAVHRVPAAVDRSGRSGTVRLLFVGRYPHEGTARRNPVLDQVRDLDVALDVVGDGNDRAACEELVVIRGLRTVSTSTAGGRFLARKSPKFHEIRDVFVFPSYREPGGNVALEAMASGLPVIICERGRPRSQRG